ncbi:hypothetical protein EVG20_g6186 [Dentipellis fragilis]|uniref:aldehyde dehydrogenase (NAD(+)) n=1 Tax=Dentipellis fragilis TaxID=205917 RepID=A0A4Y9YNM1_9AGAM|nr:hypothetical protein EVG20_g6186 [Dentipellis fragilis]
MPLLPSSSAFLLSRATLYIPSKSLSTRASAILSALDIPTDPIELDGVYDGEWKGSGDVLESICPATGEVLARVKSASPKELHTAIVKSREAYSQFKSVPAPRRGDIVRQIREALASKREELGALVSLEMGKIRTEGVGEVQEFVDICDYATGLSRMMNGRVVSSERPGHSILEVPNPLGVIGVLSAFNFPVAVYGWNLAISLAAGNATIWKPAPTTPLCALAITRVVSTVLERNGIPGAVAALVIGGRDAGEALVQNKDIDLGMNGFSSPFSALIFILFHPTSVSFTGSEAVGRVVGKVVQARFGKVLLELGGNNAAIVAPSADLTLAIPAVFFGAVGTAGQRCTSTRRLFLHRSIASEFLSRLQSLYESLTPGDPLVSSTLLGPLHSRAAMGIFGAAVADLNHTGAEILAGGSPWSGLETALRSGNYVQPTIAIPSSLPDTQDGIWTTERFAPVLNVAIFDELEEAIAWNNAVPQGLSSSLWTRDLRDMGKWIGPAGSDTGIVNVNVGTSGAEIGAAFGGNKSTGWGRESGGDAWKQYVRWSACTVNYSDAAPLAQGVSFTV